MNIQNILQEIYDTGLTDAAISRAITESGHKISQPVIYRLRKGINKKISHERHMTIKKFYLSNFKKDQNNSEEAA